jgi:hypothetical protein
MTAQRATEAVRGFIGHCQMRAIAAGLFSEERMFFYEKLLELARIIEAMPTTGKTDGQGTAAIVQLRYFAGGSGEWLITEKDVGAIGDGPEDFQSQAFGLACPFGDAGELGYISIRELINAGAQLDLHWTPKPLAEAKR